MLTSCLCTQASLLSPQMQEWQLRFKERPIHLHRKIWEWCYISEALAERGMLRPGMRGLGFAVGQEPLTAMYARMGASIVATDLFVEKAEESGWVSTGQHADGFDALNQRQLCDKTEFNRLVDFRFADMNDIGGSFNGSFDGQFDFLWSSCAFEHLGDIEKGLRFVREAMRCLKPGGFAVHTTEFNLSSDADTVESGATVLFRRQDIERLAGELRAEGHAIEFDWDQGEGYADKTVDLPPYKQHVHLRMQIEQYVVTSIGLIIRKAGAAHADATDKRPAPGRLGQLFGRLGGKD
ncbi:SAM-dependent methyltransferase [Noviherbaspirillum galbum]|uniref:Class I SAM-dependent methyltransferase n=1 Tax=Noviherbaspirillum galbum TaxID=2709383 RepID=A0A6B3SJK1_9BURK|nr:methyltransferase domain-containing protein [Noviherbaspirillum galbum]NEX60900.1 class I SAM-dependent methyltransferase [Noviherbaspirillum galbum]